MNTPAFSLVPGQAHIPAHAEGANLVAPIIDLSATYVGRKLTITWAGIPFPTPKDWLQVFQGNGKRAAWAYTNGKVTLTKKSEGIASGTVTLTPRALYGPLRITLQANHGPVVLASITINAIQRRIKDRRTT